MEIKFRRDTQFRKQFFVPDSFAHPAKMDAQLLLWIVENYTKASETILDPMAGSGTTMLACTLGRHCILVELEEKFCKMMRDNWEQVKMRPQLGSEMGNCQIIQGDARQLENILVDKIISSPPYGNRLSDGEVDDGDPQRMSYRQTLGQIDKIVTSPPYGNPRDTTEEYDDKYDLRRPKGVAWGRESFRGRYGKGDGQIGNLPYGQIDKIVTSPPYEGSLDADTSGIDWSKGTRGRAENWKPRDRSKEPAFGKIAGFGIPLRYSNSQDNIGNLRSQSYLEAMLQVYQQCYKVLKPQGLMILVTKDFIRDKKRVDLAGDTIKLCEQAGFSFVERHYRKLPSQSFWRVIYHQKYPNVEQIDHEDVLVLRKSP